ncbi:hypothetical protein DNI29_04410 [Hymenobacter sediminis]|uniref:hypothetical protein n=1 Tax=Hymenobacter sediminis TaxID=2218621 RepID=UPI000DA6A963|nr:hypothetical protein [Hymenobacter sediminis]RPD50045.1 hypothetical protein DNI29_04410 [Hymenobacter sediminis]
MATCDLPLVAVDNDAKNCDGSGNPIPALGTQIPVIFYQDMEGTAPDLTTQAGAQAAMTATGVNQVFILKNLAVGIVPAPTDQTLTGNDVPYGATILTNRTRTMTARAQYPTNATHAAVSQHNQAQRPVRVWLLDNNDYLQGPWENASIVFGGLERPGLGQAIPANYPLTVTFDSIAEAPVSAAQLKFLKSLTNA